MPLDFSSDTSAPTHPAVLTALAEANQGSAPSYGGDPFSARLQAALMALFETETLAVWPCASGTAANALALSVMCRPTGAILCHEEAHIERDERGAPEFFTGGAKLHLLPGEGGQIEEQALRDALAALQPDFVHETPAEVLSLTQLTECGTAYTIDRLTHYAALAHEAGLTVHIDGARFANALVRREVSPAEMSWKAGIDVLTLGLTKTGAIGCELIILFGEMAERASLLRARAKRGGHMPPKLRFLAAQALALFEDGLWLDLARRANRSARLVADLLCAQPGVELAYPVDGNEVFVRLPQDLLRRLSNAGATFYPWPGGSHRLVCSWATGGDTIEDLSRLLRDQT
jgi:threonine aldolase